MPRGVDEGEVLFQFAVAGGSGVRIGEGYIAINVELSRGECETFNEK